MESEREAAGGGRLAAIDILRGIAILWVVLFHIWGDLEYFPGVPREYYEQLTWQVQHGRGIGAISTAFTDLLFRDGFQGVPLFMMISGLSLTIAAYRSGDGPSWPRFMLARFRKLLLPYWFGVVLTYGVIAAIAWRQSTIGDGGFAAQWGGGVTIARFSIVNVDWHVVYASFALMPRLLDAEYFFAPQLALWFAALIAQYYLLFPLLFWLMRRIGVAPFIILTFALTVGANWWIIQQFGAPEIKFSLVTGWAPFRLFEFTSGMALGWLLVDPRARRWLAFARQPAVIVLALVAGLAAHTGGDLLIGQWQAQYWQSLALPLVTLGLALLALPLLVRWPSRIDGWAPVRAFATLGVMSYGILIVSDAMRLVASQLRVEGVPAGWWWAFLIGIYVPASVAIAWPVSKAFGLMPRRDLSAAERRLQRARAPQPAPLPAVDSVGATTRARARAIAGRTGP
jgi:peptidoglycan/LPS O-acetylase OafA/YrhL